MARFRHAGSVQTESETPIKTRRRIAKGHLRLRGHVWWVQWKHRGKCFQSSLRTGNKREAEALFEKHMTLVRAAIISGKQETLVPDSEPSSTEAVVDDIRLEDAWARYLRSVAKPEASVNSMFQYALQFGRLVSWVNRKGVPSTIRTFTKEAAREFAYELAGKAAAATYNRYVNLCRLVFRVLLEELGCKGDNPWEGIQSKRMSGDGRRSFKPQEVASIFAVIDGQIAGEEIIRRAKGGEVVRRLDASQIALAKEMRTLCLLAYHTGLRFGDCSILQWSEVDLDKGLIVHVPSKTRRRHPNRPVIIPLSTELSAHLSTLPRKDSPTFVCPRAAAKYGHINGHGHFEGILAFMRILKLAGIRTHKFGTGPGTGKRAVVEVGFHSFRHTFVTTSEEAGIDQATVRAVVGWGSPAMERVYSHIGQDHLRTAMAKRSSFSVTTGTPAMENGNGERQDVVKPSAETAALDGMSKDDLERLLAAVAGKIKEVDATSLSERPAVQTLVLTGNGTSSAG